MFVRMFEAILCHLIFLRHLIRSRAVTNRTYFLRINLFFYHAGAAWSELPSNISTMRETLSLSGFVKKKQVTSKLRPQMYLPKCNSCLYKMVLAERISQEYVFSDYYPALKTLVFMKMIWTQLESLFFCNCTRAPDQEIFH